LAVAASVSSNIRRIVTFFEAEAKRTTKGKRHRDDSTKAEKEHPCQASKQARPITEDFSLPASSHLIALIHAESAPRIPNQRP
jgi:hypothetical protein